MIPNVKPSQLYPVKGAIAPQSIAAAGTANSGWLAVPPGCKWLFLELLNGVLGGGSEQVDVEQATDNAGTGAKALLTNAMTNAVNNTQSQTEVNLDQLLDVNNGFAFYRVKVTNTGGTGALVAVSVKAGPALFTA